MKRGFTLIELLVVIAIIAILAAILFPVFAKAREKARQTSCLSNLKQMSLGLLMYAQDYDECFPGTYEKMGQSADWPLVAWWDIIQPYVKNTQLMVCPSTRTYPSYGANRSLMPDARDDFDSSMGKITKPSETFLVFDAWQAASWCADGNWYAGHPGCGCYGARAAGTRNDGLDISAHNDGFNAALADGHAKWYRRGTADWDYANFWQKTR
jgi:prepilin-type N-terminal cleavage/methylation domain-containing protein/prepilin-type processing-associated H-X9-DG protein